ncbi:MAG: two-component regulator propeller domain-containing protein, partial [Catalinimonas sp.]
LTFDPDGTVTTWQPSRPVQDALRDDEGCLWMADYRNGMTKACAPGGEVEVFTPEGPTSTVTFGLYTHDDRIVLLHGGYNLSSSVERGQDVGFSTFQESTWDNYSSLNGRMPYANDLVGAAYNPRNGSFYVSSYGWGVIEFASDCTITRWSNDNASLLSVEQPGVQPGPPFVRIGGMTVDREGNLWVANTFAPSRPLHVLRPDGTWESFAIGNVGVRAILDVMIDRNGYKWCRHWNTSSATLGMVVFDEVENQARRITTDNGLPSNLVRDVVEDEDGLIWVATDGGVVVFYDSFDVFERAIQAEGPRVRINATQSTTLLSNERVNCIAVDGGNRKWIGTDNGLYLVSPDGSEVIQQFTRSNSPLYSNRIIDVTVNGRSGEVFVALDEGVISYRSDATDAAPTHGTVRAFPNPVRPEYEGLITISGLATDAVVKITDVSGKLVHEGRAAGGTATWNGRDYNGRAARTGVYLVFSATEDGTESFVTKIAVVE